jgi:hypothetical protein
MPFIVSDPNPAWVPFLVLLTGVGLGIFYFIVWRCCTWDGQSSDLLSLYAIRVDQYAKVRLTLLQNMKLEDGQDTKHSEQLESITNEASHRQVERLTQQVFPTLYETPVASTYKWYAHDYKQYEAVVIEANRLINMYHQQAPPKELEKWRAIMADAMACNALIAPMIHKLRNHPNFAREQMLALAIQQTEHTRRAADQATSAATAAWLSFCCHRR